LFLRNLDVRLPGLHVRRLRLNRHLPEADRVEKHRHRFSQFLLYLAGRGLQEIGKEVLNIRSGTAIFLPPGQAHAFRETSPRRPLCLVVDLDLRGAPARGWSALELPGHELLAIRHELANLGRMSPGRGAGLRMAATVLAVLDILLRAMGWWPGDRRGLPGDLPIVRAVRKRLASREGQVLTLREVSAQLGYQQDALNRLLRDACGLTLGQLRNEARLLAAKRGLAARYSIREAGARAGFDDPNYFARWFKRQTGLSPRKWKGAKAHL
jgi:AraC-like DNA-binding protein